MASSLHRNAMAQMLYEYNGGGGPVSGFAQDGNKLKLYTSASSPSKDGIEGVEFIEVASGSGYVPDGKQIDFVDHVLGNAPTPPTPANKQIVIQYLGADPSWTASGGSILNIAGAYLTDANDMVLAWWERAAPLTLGDGDTLVCDDLTIRLLANNGEA